MLIINYFSLGTILIGRMNMCSGVYIVRAHSAGHHFFCLDRSGGRKEENSSIVSSLSRMCLVLDYFEI